MRMRVREIIKMHLDSGMIRLERPEDVNGITEPVSALRSKEKRMCRRV